MKEKVLGIIARRTDEQIHFLALRNNPADPEHGGDFYYVVTGSVEEGENHEMALLREIDEETGIKNVIKLKIFPMVAEFIDDRGNECTETMHAILTDEDVSHLSIEHVEYKWLEKQEFKNLVRWYGTSEELEVLLREIETW